MTSGPTVSIARDELPVQSGHILALDGLRCFAVLQVMLNHFVIATRPGDGKMVVVASNLFQFLGNGVYLFFVLSGFLITGILLRAKNSDSYFGTFYARRTLRIFPLYYAVLIAVFGGLWAYRLSGSALSEDAAYAFETQGWLWLYLSNFSLALSDAPRDFGFFRFGHFWTLAVEEQFYLIWPLLIFVLDGKWLRRVCIGACVVLLAARYVFIRNENVSFYLLSSDGLFIGSWLATATVTRTPSPRVARRSALVFLIAGALSLGLIAGAFAARAGVMPQAVIAPLLPLNKTAQCVMFAGLLMWTISSAPLSPLRRLMEWRSAVYIGKISYGVYVYHVLLIELFIWIAARYVGNQIGQPVLAWGANVLVCATLAIGVAAISWKLFEQPVLRLKDRFNYKPRTTTPTSQEAGNARPT